MAHTEVSARPPFSSCARLVASLAPALIAALIGCGQDPLSFAIQPITVGYDAHEILDADAVDLERDGDGDLVVATAVDFRYLEAHGGRYTDQTAGSALGKVAAAQAMHKDGDDYILERGDQQVRLEYSGIGSWHESGEPVEDFEPAPMLEVSADLDGDGQADRVRLEGSALVLELARGEARLDVTALVGLDGLTLPKPGRRLRAADLDGDGDMDLLVVGGRLFVLINNGGEVARP